MAVKILLEQLPSASNLSQIHEITSRVGGSIVNSHLHHLHSSQISNITPELTCVT
jgi:hypothetical protein